MKGKDIVLGIITLGLCIGLLANMILHYLPDNTYVLAIITIVIVCILLFIFGREDSKKNILTILWQKFAPRKTIGFIPYTSYGRFNNHWSNEEYNGEPFIQIQGEWHATNRIDESIRILRAYLVNPRTEAWVRTQVRYGDKFEDRDWIPPGDVVKVIVTVQVQPSICEEGEDFIGKIVFIDQFNRKHKVKATFEYCGQEW